MQCAVNAWAVNVPTARLGQPKARYQGPCEPGCKQPARPLYHDTHTTIRHQHVGDTFVNDKRQLTSKVVLGVLVERHLSDGPQRELLLRPRVRQVEHVDALFLEELLRLFLVHRLDLHRPAGVFLPGDGFVQVLGRIVRGQGGGLFRGEGLGALVGDQVELGVDPLAGLVDELEGVSVVPVHVTVAIRDTSVTEEDHDLVDRLGVVGKVVPEVGTVIG
jgi:hypothetical protein